MTELTDSPDPALIDPQKHGPFPGDTADDDGLAIDDYFRAAPYDTSMGGTGPVESESVAFAKESVKAPTRLLSRKVTVGTVGGVLYDPVQVLPRDIHRCGLIVDADGPVSITSDKTDCYGAATVITYPWSSVNHTGAVWVYSTETDPVIVNVWSVTE